MKIAVCDDWPGDRGLIIPMLREYLASRNLTAEFLEYDTGAQLLEAFRPGMFEMVFLDIYMPGISGMDAAWSLKGADPDCLIIFTTTSLEHGAEAFDVEAFHYLVKPVDKRKLFAALDKWYNRLCEAKTIELKCARVSRTVYISDILYIDVLGRNSTVHTAAERIETGMSLTSIEAMLPKGEFCRPIRYCLASMRHIRSIRDDGILMDDGEVLALSRLEKENLREQLADFRLRALRGR